MKGRIGLAAIQPRLDLDHYRSEESFFSWLDRLTAQARNELKGAEALLLGFPEALGLPLLLFPITGKKRRAKSLTQAFLTAFFETPSLWKELKRARGSLLRAFYLARAKKAFVLYHRTFSRLAARHRAYICAGSIYLPSLEWEPIGKLSIQDPFVRNQSFFYTPSGTCLGRVEKIHLAPPDEIKGKFTAGRLAFLVPYHLPFGKVGTLICYDGFHKTLIELYDAQGVQIVIQPSFNTDPWDAPWRYDPRISQAQAWVRDGLRKMVQKRENIVYGVNPMLVGEFYNLKGEGRSAIVADRSKASGTAYGYPGFLAIARTKDEEEVVTACVPYPF